MRDKRNLSVARSRTRPWTLDLGPWTLTLLATLSLATPAAAQLRDSFEDPQPTWSLTREADCGVRELAHDRSYRDSRSGQASEHFRLQVGNGTFVYLAQSIGRAAVIPEFRPTLFLKADRPSLQLMVRVVFPRSLDRGTGQPITSLLRGDMYTAVGEWQQLQVRDASKLLEQEARHLRSQFGPDVDPREAFIDLIVLNAYSGPGPIDLWIDDLEIDGYINLDNANGPQLARRPSGQDAPAAGEAGGAPAAAVQGGMFLVRGRPLVPRIIQHRGEPFEWLRSLGFNTIKLSASPSPVELKEARRLGLWVIAPPPYADQPRPAEGFDPVIAWSLGARLTDRDLLSTRQLISEVRAADPQADRPLLAGVDAGLDEFSREASLLAFERPTLGTTHELAGSREWFLGRSRLSRPGTPVLATLETQRSRRLGEQLMLFGRGAAWDEDVDPQQLRLAAYHAVAAGARGFAFSSEQALAIDTGPAALRTDAIRLLNMELKLLEPWIAGGQLTDEPTAGDQSASVTVLATDRSRLILLTQLAPAQQFVLGPPPRNSISLVVPGVSMSSQAYSVSLAAIKPLRISHSSSGARITLEDAPHAAAIVVTQDPLALLHLNRTQDEHKQESCRLRYDITARRLAHTMEIDQKLTELGHPLAPAAGWLRDAYDSLQQAQRLFSSYDFASSQAMTTKAEHLLARVRSGHWEQTAGAFPSPAASPCIAQFTTLPLHWSVADRVSRGQWGPNVQAAGDMESLDQMLKAGWQQQRPAPEGISTDVSLSLADPHSGRTALRLQAWSADARRAPQVFEKPLVFVTSSPVPARQGQLARISGWVHVPRQLAGTTEGLLVFDSVGGPDLGDRVRLTQGWREFTLYRAVPQSGDLTITFALTGLGEASLDDLAVSLLEAEPIRPAK